MIECFWPSQKISAESQKERKAVQGQTLTALGSYWKGRKPLVLVRACILGALLPVTDNPTLDLEIFEKLMLIDDEAFLVRDKSTRPSLIVQHALETGLAQPSDVERLFKFSGALHGPELDNDQIKEINRSFSAVISASEDARKAFSKSLARLSTHHDRVLKSERPEQIGEEPLQFHWPMINNHLRTNASSISELVEQLGVMRFGHPPKIADTFSGSGSIPFEAARIGADAFASDLNPIACMLTWGAMHIVGAADQQRLALATAQRSVDQRVAKSIESLGVEQDESGNKAKTFLYCLEATCPQSGWVVPLLPSLVISRSRRCVAALLPNKETKRYEIEIRSGVSLTELKESEQGTIVGGNLVHSVDGTVFRSSLKTVRGDYKAANGATANALRKWDVSDVRPRSADIFQERLYCIQWFSSETLGTSRPETFFAAPTEADLEREDIVARYVESHLSKWQAEGLVPDMPIEPGFNTDQPIRERGWTYWHHLFSPRQILLGALMLQAIKESGEPSLLLNFGRWLDNNNKLCRWIAAQLNSSGKPLHGDKISNLFYNQALNTLFNYGVRSSTNQNVESYKSYPLKGKGSILCQSAREIRQVNDIYITDPPYADAVHYHEITELFIAWLRKNPPAPFDQWTWDSRRPLAIQGDGEEFRREMMTAYKAMADHMPDNGLQVVMFTHQSGSVWADMAQIFWGAGLQVQSAWYIATETTSELKKGGYVQGTVILVLRKRVNGRDGFGDEIAQFVRSEVANQIDNLVGLNQSLKGAGRVENLFEDADLQMAGYAAALRVLTGYTSIDGRDMTAEAIRPRAKGQKTYVDEIIEFAVQVANEHMVPDGLTSQLWERLSSSERFYLKMLDVEGEGISKLDNYQNFARAFRVADYASFMGSIQPNAARIKTAADFRKSDFTSEFGQSATRALLYAIWQISEDVDADIAHTQLRELVTEYGRRRDDLVQIALYISSRRDASSAESRSAKIVANLIRNERL